ncbi:MAG: hypothetical protein ACO1NZ_18150 [Adhaeribacter sp.]
MNKRNLIFLCLMLLGACQQKPTEKQQVQELETQVLAVHDEAMAKMDQVFILRQNLKKLRDSLGTTATDTLLLQNLEQHIRLLQQADDNMMKWMHWYKKPEDTLPEGEAKSYLRQQLLKIEQVQKTMDSTLTAARQFQQQHETHP